MNEVASSVLSAPKVRAGHSDGTGGEGWANAGDCRGAPGHPGEDPGSLGSWGSGAEGWERGNHLAFPCWLWALGRGRTEVPEQPGLCDTRGGKLLAA